MFLITGVSQTGGGGPPLGNFSHIIPFFSLSAFLIESEEFQTSIAYLPIEQVRSTKVRNCEKRNGGTFSPSSDGGRFARAEEEGGREDKTQ